MSTSRVLVAVVALALVAGLACAVPRVTREHSWHGVPAGWRVSHRVSGDERLLVVVGVRQTNLAALEARLLAVSDPDSPEFSNHMTLSEVDALVAPSTESVAAVLAWLQSYGVDMAAVRSSGNADFLWFEADVLLAEKLLEVEYHRYQHDASGIRVVRANRPYSLPAFVQPHVDFVAPTGGFPAVQSRRVRTSRQLVDAAAAAVGAAPPNGTNQLGGIITPAVLRALYGVGNYSATSNVQQACASFLNQFYAPADLQSFFQQFDPAAVGRTPILYGPNDATNPGTEASLDIQYIMGLGNNVTTQFWSTLGEQPHNPGNEPFLVWLTNVSAMTDAELPKTISVSYGDNENTVDFDYASRMNVEFQKLGVRGVSIMFSSGDGGVAGGQTSECPGGVFIPTYPAGSPWVTAVGGTASSNPEVAASFSSGGFSNYWARPSFQDAAVQQYFSVATNLPPSNVYNATGAGIPDVSAQSESFNVVQGGSVVPFGVDGTSCSSPSFTGIISLLNDIRANQGKKPLGFLNQLIYKNPQLFNDVTSGNNPGCNSNGFYAAPGWDPVTGLGTPNFAALSAFVQNLP